MVSAEWSLTGALKDNPAAYDWGDPRTFTGATVGDLPFSVTAVWKHHNPEQGLLYYLVNVHDRGRLHRIVLHKISDQSNNTGNLVRIVKYFCKMDMVPPRETWYAKIIDTEDNERDVRVVYREMFRPGEQM